LEIRKLQGSSCFILSGANLAISAYVNDFFKLQQIRCGSLSPFTRALSGAVVVVNKNGPSRIARQRAHSLKIFESTAHPTSTSSSPHQRRKISNYYIDISIPSLSAPSSP
jgi:hypothetical protein